MIFFIYIIIFVLRVAVVGALYAWIFFLHAHAQLYNFAGYMFVVPLTMYFTFITILSIRHIPDLFNTESDKQF